MAQNLNPSTGTSTTDSAGVPVSQAELMEIPFANFVWLSMPRSVFVAQTEWVQSKLQTLCGLQLVDLHVSDLQSVQLPSHFDYTADYDLLVFRRLVTSIASAPIAAFGASRTGSELKTARPLPVPPPPRASPSRPARAS